MALRGEGLVQRRTVAASSDNQVMYVMPNFNVLPHNYQLSEFPEKKPEP